MHERGLDRFFEKVVTAWIRVAARALESRLWYRCIDARRASGIVRVDPGMIRIFGAAEGLFEAKAASGEATDNDRSCE